MAVFFVLIFEILMVKAHAEEPAISNGLQPFQLLERGKGPFCPDGLLIEFLSEWKWWMATTTVSAAGALGWYLYWRSHRKNAALMVLLLERMLELNEKADAEVALLQENLEIKEKFLELLQGINPLEEALISLRGINDSLQNQLAAVQAANDAMQALWMGFERYLLPN
jgi:hypothetical protein